MYCSKCNRKTKGLKIMKKTLPIIFSLALISCSFTACGDKDKNSGANGTTKAPTMAVDETSGLNSATDASMDGAQGNNGNTGNTDNNNGNDRNNGNGGIGDNLVTDAEGLVDDLVSTGEDIVDDAGSVIEGAGDAIMGTD
jgi:hypothetical protein